MFLATGGFKAGDRTLKLITGIDRDNWNDDPRQRCELCGLEEDCNCDNELEDIL